MKGKIDQSAIRLDCLIKERFCLVDEVKVFKQEGRNNALALQKFHNSFQAKSEGVRQGYVQSDRACRTSIVTLTPLWYFLNMTIIKYGISKMAIN